MEPPVDKQWAAKYLLDPLTAPEPNQETGPGTHFYPTTPRGPSVKPTPPAHSRSASATAYPTPRSSASPTQSSFHPSNPYSSHRHSAFGGYPMAGPSRGSIDEPIGNGKERRSSSLGERYPGDMSHRPLDQLRKEARAANHAPHLNKRYMPGADTIDVLDSSFEDAYHHEGPYDATLLARNMNYKNSPVEAVRDSNAEALKATPMENIRDALDKHVPLQGTAVIPPGMSGLNGKTMVYEEGADLMREPDAPGGAYKRWDHIKYLPEDYKGKGESTYEMQERSRPEGSHQRSVSETNPSYTPIAGKPGGSSLKYEIQNGLKRSNTTGRRMGEGLKRRFGSLRRSKNKTTTEVSSGVGQRVGSN